MTDRNTQTSHRKHCTSQFKAAKLLAALAVAGFAQQGFAAAPAPNALPTGGQVVAGAATIATAGNTMNINQSSQRAVVNWNSFDVGSQAKVNFNQPNAQAATLNYVNSASKSMINGAVNSNGQVIFVNNNGVVFGKGAEVNVGGMVATTMNISATEFMAGNATQVYEGGATGKVINRGNITGNNINSYIALMAPQVKNTGVITATMGGNNAVALVSGQKVSLTFSGSQLVSVSVDASVVNALISNKLLIKAGSGQIIIAANSAQELMGSVIKNTGVISASDINTSGGKISLTADSIEQNGTVEANSAQANGGNISLKGNNITLASGSKTTATGATAGGNINVGVNQANTLANTVAIEANAIVDASATQNGNGGNINIWSQIKTLVAGNLFAKGGAQGGNGGHIETSSKGNVAIAASATVDTSAPKGRSGMWVIDPITLIIDSAAASAISNALNTTSVTLDAIGSACAFGSCTNSQSALIRIMAGADIYSSNTATSLNLIATGGQIDIHSNITAGSVYAVAQAINVYGSVNTNGGSNSNIYLAGAIINILGNINSNGNNQNNSSSSNLNSANTITGANRRNGQNGLNADSNTYSSNGGLINILATGDITVDTNSYISSNGVNGGVVTITSTAGKVTINGIVDSIGKSNAAGNIMIAGKTETNLIGSLISVEGLNVGGMINLGQINNLGNGTILAPPATAPPALITFVQDSVAAATSNSATSITSSNINIDSQTGINAPNGNIVVFGEQIQINNSSITATNGTIAIGRPSYAQGGLAGLTAISNSALTANRVETSGQLFGIQNNSVLASEWLLDPTNVIIGATSTTGTLAADLVNSGVTNIKAADIQTALNAGTSVTVAATGTITWSAGYAITVTNNTANNTLTLTTVVGGGQNAASGITLLSAITATAGSKTTSLVVQTPGSEITLGTGTSAGVTSAPTLNVSGTITIDNLTNNPNVTANVTNGITLFGNLTAVGNVAINGYSYTISGTPIVSGNPLNTWGAITSSQGNISVRVTQGEGVTGHPASIPKLLRLENPSVWTALNGGVTINGTTNTWNANGNLLIWGTIKAQTLLINSRGLNPGSVGSVILAGATIEIGGGTYTAGQNAFEINSSTSDGGTSAGILFTSQTVGTTVTNSVIKLLAPAAGSLYAGNISFSSNGDVSLGSTALTYAPNTTANPNTITVSTAGTVINGVQYYGDKTSQISHDLTTDFMTIAASGVTPAAVSGTNIQFLAAGGEIKTGALTTSGFINLDNTYGCLGASCVPASGFVTAANANTLASINYGVLLQGALTSGSLVPSGTKGITITGISGANTPACVNAGATVCGQGVSTGGFALTSNAGGISIYGAAYNMASAYPVAGLGASVITINGSGNLSVTAKRQLGTSYGISSTGAINDNVAGSSILFTANGAITQTGNVTVAANTTGTASSIVYDTTSGNNASTITAGVLAITGTSTSAINFTEISSGAAISAKPLNVPGYILLDMTNGGAVAASASTTATGVTVTGNLIAGNLAGATNGIGIYGLSTTGTAVSVGNFSLTNAKGNIYISGFESAAGGASGISLASAMAGTSNSIVQNANGGSITLISNNAISHGGNISIAQNTSGVVSNITYDTTYGNKLSTINASNVTFNGTSTSYINYSNIASGAPIVVNSALVVPGAITFDNTYLNGVQGGINTNNAWSLATSATAQKGIYVTASLTASNGIYIRGVVGATSASAVSCCNAVDIGGSTAITLQTTGTFATGSSAIEVIGIQPIYNMTATTFIQNAIAIHGTVSIINNATRGKTNLIAISGNYDDAVTITNAATAGSINVSAIGITAQVVTVSGTLFTQNSNDGIFIASSQNGNVTPPQIINNGTGPVVIEAGAYYPVGTVFTGTCTAKACGQITTVAGNTITSALGDVYLYAGSPGTTAGTTTTTAALNVLDTSLNTLTFGNTLFGQAYAAGNVPATLIPLDTLAALNTANVAPGTGYTSWTTTSANGPVIQFRIQPTVQANLSGNVTKVYGADDPLATSGNLATVGSLDYQLNALFVKNATVNPGYVANGATGCLNQPSGCMKTTVNGLNFFLPMDDFINSLQASLPTPRASYGTVAGEQVNGTSSTVYTSSYAYNLTSNHGVLVTSGISVNLQPASGTVGLVITPAPLTITASNQTIQAGDVFTAGTTAFTTSGLALAPNGVVLGDAISGVTLAAPTYTGQATAGTYAINASAPVFSTGSASNYAITYAPGTLTTTTNLIITITALAESKIYGSSAISSPSSITYNGSGVAVVSGPASALYTITGLPVGGTYTIDSLTFTSAGGIASASVGGSPYTVTPSAVSITTASGSPSIAGASYIYQPGLMTVTPRPITITATPVTTTYGSATPITQTGYTASNNLVAGDTITGATVNYVGASTSTTVPGTLGAGTYSSAIVPSAATGTGGFNSTNYAITYAPADLVVNKLAVIVTANAQSTVYGTALALGTTAFTNSIGTLPNGDAITAATLQYNGSPSVPATTNAGSYTIAASAATGTGGFGSANYDVTYATGPLTVTPAPITISATAPTQSVVYSGSAQTFNAATGLTISGLKNGETAVLGATGLGSGTNVGVYTNTVDANLITSITGGNALLSNYTVTYSGAQAALNIIPAPLSITGAFTSAVYDAAAHTNTAPTVTGLKGSDAVALPMGVLGTGTNAGTYADVLAPVFTTGSANNYTITTTNGALTITPKAATITGNTTVNPYSGALQTNTYSTTGIITGDAVTVGGVATATHVSQGTVPDVFTVSGASAGNYTFTYAPGSITITPVALTVVGATTSAVYNKTTQTNSAATVTGLLGSDTATIGGTYGSGINAGVYTDSLSVGLSNPSDYAVSITNGTHTITPATITVNGITAQNKMYDATTAATLNVGTITTTGVLPGDTVTLQTSTLSGVFTDKNVGNGKTVLISGVVLAGTDSANYQLSGGANTTTTANITPAPLTITGVDLTTTYNASVQSLAAPTVTGLIAGDNVTVAGNATGTNAGAYAAAYTATGVDAGNYTVTANAPVLTINKANLVVTANNAGKFYGQADPVFTATIAGLQGSDTATVNSVTSTVTGTTAATGTYPTAINASGVTSTNLANYNVTYVPGAYTITPADVLVITMNAATTTYGTAAAPTVASVQFATGTGVNTTVVTLTKSGDTYTDGAYSITVTPAITDQGVIPVVSGASTTWNVGAYTNAVSNTNNYNPTGSPFLGVTTITNTLTITPAPLALTVADVSKVYNANPITAGQISSGVTVTGGALMNNQNLAGLGGVTLSGSAIGAINVGSYAINGSVGSGFSNYTVTITNGTATVTPAPLTITGANSSTAYNGAIQTNTAATVTGLQGSDSVTVAGYATGLHAGPTTDALTISGTLASNYTPTYVNGTLTITPASLVVTGAVNSYAYNGAVQTNSGASISGLKGSDTATIAGYAEATHVSQGAVPDSLVATLSNPADYTVTYNQGSLSITPIQINAVVASQTVQYNAAEQTTSYTVTGLKGSDTATAFSGTATGTNVGSYTSNLTLVASSDYYVGTITNGTLTITPAPLTITSGLTAQNKVYDTTTVASINATATQTLTGVLGSDLISVSSTGPYTGTFSQSNVGTNLNVTPVTTTTMINGVAYTTMAGVTLTGTAASNYYVTGLTTPIAANITPAPLTIAAGVTAQSKVYDGTTAATITASTQTLAGVLGGDAVSVSSTGPYTGTFSQSNVGSNLTVTPTTATSTIGGVDYTTMAGVTLTGAAAGNYYVTGISAPVVANITPYVIVPGSTTGPRIVAAAIDKVYDTTTVANGSLAMAGLFGSDVVSVNYSAASFANPNVASGITVTFANPSLSGADAANYTIGTGAVTALAAITPAPLTITANTQSSFVTQAIGALSYSTVGLLGGDTVTAATLATTATSSSVAGNNYPITVSAATISSGASNYDITYVPSTYTIIPAGQLRVQTSGAITPYGTAATYANPTASYLTTSGAVISNLSFVSATTAGGITTYTYADGASGTVSFNLSPTGTTTSTSGNIVIGTYPLAAANFASTTGNLTAGSAVVSGDLTVTPLAVNIAAAPVSYVYNGTTQSQVAAVATPSILTNDLVTVSGIATGRNVGIYNSSLAASGADAANYSFTYTNAALTITPYVIDPNATTGPRITATANNKVYDASTVATGALGMTGLFAGDVVTASYTSADFASKNVANGITVTFNGVTLSDPNYAVGSGAVTATANITPAPLTIATGLAAQNKVYDTTTAATISATGVQTLSGLLGTDAVTVASTGPYTGTFSQSNVGTTLAVTPTTTSTTINGVAYTTMAGVTLTGADAGNYYVSGPSSTLTANITGKAITIYALDQASFYSKPLNTLGYAPVVGLLSGASVTGATLATTATATGTNSAAGPYTITASDAVGTGLSNYLITYAPATYTIVPAGQLLVSTAGVTTTYGTGTATAGPIINPAQPTATYIASNGAAISSLTFVSSSTSGTVVSYVFRDSANAEISFNLRPVTTNDNISSSSNIKIGNYDYLASSLSAIPAGLTTAATVTTGALTVMPLAVTVTATAATTAYNGAVQSQVPATLTPNIVAGDLVTVNGIATGKTVGVYGSALSTAGADIGNYQFTYVNNNLTITPYIINYGAGGTGPGIAASASNKVYNTNTLANGALSMVNLFPGDSVTANFGSATFATPNVGNNITVTFNGVTLSGPDALNYAVGNTPVTTTAKITPAPVTISGLVAANKRYDGNTAAVITGTPTITGLLGSDTSTLTGSVLSGIFATSNPGAGISVTANLSDLILGNGNYYIADVTFPLTAEIIAPPQQISNMAILQQQVAADVVRRDPENLIYKGELLYVRDKDNMPEYLQAIEVPSSGAFKFPVPDQIIQDLIDLSGENKGATAKLATYKLLRLPKGTKVYATLANGAALPAGITFNSATQAFTVPKLGNVTLPISVKLTLKRGNQTLSEKVLVVTK